MKSKMIITSTIGTLFSAFIIADSHLDGWTIIGTLLFLANIKFLLDSLNFNPKKSDNVSH